MRNRSRLALTAGALAGTAAVAVAAGRAAHDIRLALGARPSGERAERVRRSPQFRDGRFRNPVPASLLAPGTGRELLRDMYRNRHQRRPSRPVPLVTPASIDLSADSLHAVWLGHSTVLVEIEGRRVLFDPIWSERCSPLRLIGPRRLHPVPVPLTALPALDAIVISHDHYDHLDMATVRGLTALQSAPFVVPIGVGAHLDRWGVPPARIIELDWQENVTLAGLRLTAAAARHFSGRSLARDPTLWASWILAGQSRRVFYTGDSGYFDGYAQIGVTHGPFDATMIQIGAYACAWPDVHMTPEEGVTAHLALHGRVLIPLHWATFALAPHAWAEPADRLWREATARGVTIAVPRPGERVNLDAPPTVDGWWQEVA